MNREEEGLRTCAQKVPAGDPRSAHIVDEERGV